MNVSKHKITGDGVEEYLSFKSQNGWNKLLVLVDKTKLDNGDGVTLSFSVIKADGEAPVGSFVNRCNVITPDANDVEIGTTIDKKKINIYFKKVDGHLVIGYINTYIYIVKSRKLYDFAKELIEESVL